MSQRRVIIIVGSAVVALLVAVLVVGLLILNNMNPPSEEDRFWSCMSSHGFDRDKPVVDSGKTMDDFRAATAECEAD